MWPEVQYYLGLKWLKLWYIQTLMNAVMPGQPWKMIHVNLYSCIHGIVLYIILKRWRELTECETSDLVCQLRNSLMPAPTVSSSTWQTSCSRHTVNLTKPDMCFLILFSCIHCLLYSWMIYIHTFVTIFQLVQVANKYVLFYSILFCSIHVRWLK
jgi:hypothetical protein